jgi:hypothetical protein
MSLALSFYLLIENRSQNNNASGKLAKLIKPIFK